MHLRNRAPESAVRRPGPDEDGLRGMGADSGSDDSDMGFGYPGRLLPQRRLPELRHARSLVEEVLEEEGGPGGASYGGAGAGDGAGAGGGSASLG